MRRDFLVGRMPRGGAGKGKETPIFTSVSPGTDVDVDCFDAGTIPGSGTYFCATCGSQLSLGENEALPECPCCGATEFRRDSIFEPMQEHGQTTELGVTTPFAPPHWLDLARTRLSASGRFLAYRDDEEGIKVLRVDPGWIRIGRSGAADVRLDHPSVSRRHALIVSEPPDSLRVLDDRSLNGVFLNGDLVEWARVEDGDELAIGRYRLFVLER